MASWRHISLCGAGAFVDILGTRHVCVIVEGGGVLWKVVLCEGGRKESDRLEKLPVSEYEQVTCCLGWVCWT